MAHEVIHNQALSLISNTIFIHSADVRDVRKDRI
jgi:hypothetical protein